MNNETVNLASYIWDASDEGNEYVCTMNQILEFISLRMENEGDALENLPGTCEEIEVSYDLVDGYVEQFKLWLAEQAE